LREALDRFQSDRRLTQGSYDDTCVGLLQNVTNYFQENNATLEEIIRNSGKDYNDLGRYEDCT